MKTIRFEMSEEQLTMIARALYAYRHRDEISNERAWQFEDLADNITNHTTMLEKDGSVYLLTPVTKEPS